MLKLFSDYLYWFQIFKDQSVPSIPVAVLGLFQFSLVGGFFEGTRENILHIFRAIIL